MPGDRFELQPIFNQIYEAKAQPPRALSQKRFQSLMETVWAEANQTQELNQSVHQFLTDELSNPIHSQDPGFAIQISHKENRYGHTIQREYIYRPFGRERNTRDHPTLIINNPTSFVRKLNDLFVAGCQTTAGALWIRQGILWSQISLRTIWYNATPYDFQHPEPFLDRLIHHAGDHSIKSFRQKSTKTITPLDSTVLVHNRRSRAGMEGPYTFEALLVPENKDILDPAGQLPMVYYGIDRTTAYIYAVQMAKSSVPTSDLIQFIERETQDDATRLQRYFRRKLEKFPEDYRRILGGIPQDILAMNNPSEFVSRYYDYLRQQHPDLYDPEKKISPWVQERDTRTYATQKTYEQSFKYNLADELRNLATIAQKIREFPDFRRIPQKQKELLRALYQLDKGIPPDPAYAAYKQAVEHGRGNTTLPEYPEENIFDVFRPAILSLTAACIMFQKIGIQDIVIPTYLPLRWESHLDIEEAAEKIRLQRATTNTLIRLARRVEAQVKGVTITGYPDDDGFLRMRLAPNNEPMTSDDPLLHEFIEAVSTIEPPGVNRPENPVVQ